MSGRIVSFDLSYFDAGVKYSNNFTSWQPLVYSFLSISVDALNIFSLRFEKFITRQLNWALLHLLRLKRRDTRQNVFLLLLLLFPITHDRLIFAKIFSKNW